MRKRLDQSGIFRVPSVAEGLLVKLDRSKLPPGYARDAKNLRFQTGAARSRPGNARLQNLTLPSGALSFPGTATDYGLIRVNNGCRVFSGFGPAWTLEFVGRPVGVPSPAAATTLLDIGGSGFTTLSVTSASGTPFQIDVNFRDASMGSSTTKAVGSIDSSGGAPVDRRYYVRIRRRKRDIDCLVVGSSSGTQYVAYTDQFTANGTLMKAATSNIYVGGCSIAGGVKGFKWKLDELRLWNFWWSDTSPYYWTTHPMTEIPECLFCYGFDEGGAGTTCLDRSLHENTMELVGSPTRVAGLVTGLSVGQMVSEFTDLNELQRLVATGGSIYREVMR